MTDKPSQRPAAAHSRLSALHLAPDSLAFALDCAAQAVGAVRAGSALPAALQTVIASAKHAVVRGAVPDIAYRAMRRLALADALLHKLVKKAPPPHVANVLVCAFTLLADDEAHAACTLHRGRSGSERDRGAARVRLREGPGQHGAAQLPARARCR